jgi:hypothetical protein
MRPETIRARAADLAAVGCGENAHGFVAQSALAGGGDDRGVGGEPVQAVVALAADHSKSPVNPELARRQVGQKHQSRLLRLAPKAADCPRMIPHNGPFAPKSDDFEKWLIGEVS